MSPSSRKVLVITYYWPPAGGAGVQRWLKFVKYMRDFGWEPVVYTALNGEMPVVDTSLEKDVPAGITVLRKKIIEPYTLYKFFVGRKKEERINPSFLSEKSKPGMKEKISVWIRGNLFIPDARMLWIRPSASFLKTYIEQHQISHIISTGPPHSMHLIAGRLKRFLPHVKWLADFRDPWTNIDFYDKLMLTGPADRKNRALEKKVLREADRVVSISDGMTAEFIAINEGSPGNNTKKFTTITNGYDEDDVGTGNQPIGRFVIAHIGTMVKERNPETLWKVLRELVDTNETFRQQLCIRLVGKVDGFIIERIRHHHLQDFLERVDYVPHAQVMALQNECSALLLIINQAKNADGILPGKFYEYMAAAPPVIAIGPTGGQLDKILTETLAGSLSNFNDAHTLKKISWMYSPRSERVKTAKQFCNTAGRG